MSDIDPRDQSGAQLVETVLDACVPRGRGVDPSRAAIADDVRADQPTAGRSVLPAWPLLTHLIGFPLLWMTGASLLAPAILGAIMLAFLVLHDDLRTSPGVLVWACLLAWIAVCGLSVTGVLQAVGFAQRTTELAAAGIALLYYVNARESMTPTILLRGFCVVWCTMVVLGLLAMRFPDARIYTPVGRLLPGALLQNELVRELAQPRLAEIQEPWGATEPFERPAAPFPYTNSWGMAYALLTPMMLLYWMQLRTVAARVALAIMFVASVFPAAKTSNRGMLLALGLLVAYVALRYLFSANLKAVVVTGALAVSGVIALSMTGVFESISERQEVHDSTLGRSTVYAATFEKVLESPIVGWATPSMDVTLGISLGTQGFAWMLMYSYGFVGLALFYLFLIRVLAASARFVGLGAYILHGLPCVAAITIWFYGLGFTQLLILVLIAGMLSRASTTRDSIPLCSN